MAKMYSEALPLSYGLGPFPTAIGVEKGQDRMVLTYACLTIGTLGVGHAVAGPGSCFS